MEAWKDIKGFENKYQVSSLGRVRAVNYRRTKQCSVMKPAKSFNYLSIHLTKNGKRKVYFIHRLVATAFIGNPNNKPYVNHKNGNKYDNRAINLEWVTPSENCAHRLYDLKILNLPHPPKPIICIETGEEFVSINMAAKNKKLDQGSISKALNKNKTVGGFHWRFL